MYMIIFKFIKLINKKLRLGLEHNQIKMVTISFGIISSLGYI